MKKLTVIAIIVAMVVTVLPLTGTAASESDQFIYQWSSKCGAALFTSQHAIAHPGGLQILFMSSEIVHTSWYTAIALAQVEGDLYGKTWGGTTTYLGSPEVLSDWARLGGGTHPGPDDWSYADDRFAALGMSFTVYHAAVGFLPGMIYSKEWNGYMGAEDDTAVATYSVNVIQDWLSKIGWSGWL